MPIARCRWGGVTESVSPDPGTCHVVYSSVYSPTLTAVFVSSSDALLPPPILLCMLMRLLLLGAGRTMALNGRAGSATGDVGGELAMSAAATSGRGPSRLPLTRGHCRESVRSIELSRRGGTGWLCLCVSPFRLFPPAVGAGLCCAGCAAQNRRIGVMDGTNRCLFAGLQCKKKTELNHDAPTSTTTTQ